MHRFHLHVRRIIQRAFLSLLHSLVILSLLLPAPTAGAAEDAQPANTGSLSGQPQANLPQEEEPTPTPSETPTAEPTIEVTPTPTPSETPPGDLQPTPTASATPALTETIILTDTLTLDLTGTEPWLTLSAAPLILDGNGAGQISLAWQIADSEEMLSLIATKQDVEVRLHVPQGFTPKDEALLTDFDAVTSLLTVIPDSLASSVE